MDGGQQLMDVVAVEVVGQADIKIDVAANRQGLAVERRRSCMWALRSKDRRFS